MFCDRAGIYNGIAFAPLNVTVIDDDVAGVSVSAVALRATYDNFGGALEVASYNVSLNSQPASTVIISLSGFSEFTSVSPSNIISIEPNFWDVPVVVVVSAEAPSSNRPVCASGNRFCDEIVSRSETIAQTVNSSDPYYSNLTVASVIVDVEVVYDLADPPKVKTGRFANLLNGIVVTFDTSTDRADKFGTFACTALFNLTSTAATSLFGTDNKCKFTSPQVLFIMFGSDATVLPGDLITFRDVTLQAADSASLYTTNETFAVGLPLVPTVPQVALSASALKVGVCDDLTLDGSATTGSGGRAMTYNFSVSSVVDGLSVSNVSEVLSTFNAKNEGKGTYAVTVPSSVMYTGVVMKVTLVAANFLGYSGSMSVMVNKMDVPSPMLSIQVRYKCYSIFFFLQSQLP